MTREQLEHAIRVACDLVDDEAVYVFGSQAILAQHPDAARELRQSLEVDVSPVSRLDRIERINGVLGELSQFNITHVFYVHGVPIEDASLPSGWKDRLIRVEARDFQDRLRLGLCLEGHDLAASKLAAYRDKDRDFVRVLLAERLVRPRKLISRIRTLPLSEEERERRVMWVGRTFREL